MNIFRTFWSYIPLIIIIMTTLGSLNSRAWLKVLTTRILTIIFGTLINIFLRVHDCLIIFIHSLCRGFTLLEIIIGALIWVISIVVWLCCMFWRGFEFIPIIHFISLLILIIWILFHVHILLWICEIVSLIRSIWFISIIQCFTWRRFLWSLVWLSC